MSLKSFCFVVQKINNLITPITRNDKHFRSVEAGFTVIELLTVVVVVGVLAAIAAPGWQSFQSIRRLNNAEDEAFQAIRQAQAEALRSHGNWQVSFRETGDMMQLAMHPASTDPAAATWQTLLNGIHIDTNNTTLNQQGTIYRLQFNERGQVNGQLGKLTIRTNDSDRIKRCIFASTLLGTLRRDADQGCQ